MSKYSALILFHSKSDNSITTFTPINVTLTLIRVGRHTWEPETRKHKRSKAEWFFFKDLHTWIVQLPESPSARTTPIHWFSAPGAPFPMMTALRTTHEIPLSKISGIPVTLPGGSGSFIDLISNPLSRFLSTLHTLLGPSSNPFLQPKTPTASNSLASVLLYSFFGFYPLLHLTFHEYSIEGNPSKP